VPVAALALLWLRTGRPFLFRTIAATFSLGAIGPASIESCRTWSWRAEAAGRATRTHRRRSTGTGATRATKSGWATRAAESGRATRTRPWTRRAARPWTAGSWSSLRLFDDDGATGDQATGQLLDGRLRARFGLGFDEGEAARPPGFAIHRDADAANLDLLGLEGLPQLLFVDVVGEIPYEKARSHRLPASVLDLAASMCSQRR
jgi:hypothetical protein